MECWTRCFNHKWLKVRYLQKCAENRVFRPNISVVEKKCVVLAIDCWLFSVCFELASPVFFLLPSALLPSPVLPSGSFRPLVFHFQFFPFPFPVLSCAISHSLFSQFWFFHAPFPFYPTDVPCSSVSFIPFCLLRWALLSFGLVAPAFSLFHLRLEALLEAFGVVKYP